MRLRAHITIDIDANDFIAAADHQRAVQSMLDQVRDLYPQAQLEFRERRDRADARARSEHTSPRQSTGAVHHYMDARHDQAA